MHSCPECGQACACDGEDLWNDAAEGECCHECDEGNDLATWDDYEECSWKELHDDPGWRSSY